MRGGPGERPIRTTAPVRVDARAMLAASAGLPPNVSADTAAEIRGEPGWKIDDRCRVIGAERPGRPEPDGAFSAAQVVMERYEMAEPGIVRAAYYADAPLEGRTMVLEGRFLFLRFPMPVRVGGVVEVQRQIAGRPVHVWGWSYRTLQGHLEQGRMHWEVWKWMDSGQVEFRIHAFSKRGRIRNPIVRLGFLLFGRWTQERFYRAVFDRMARLVARRTDVAFDPAPPPCEPVSEDDRVTLGPGSGGDGANSGRSA